MCKEAHTGIERAHVQGALCRDLSFVARLSIVQVFGWLASYHDLSFMVQWFAPPLKLTEVLYVSRGYTVCCLGVQVL